MVINHQWKRWVWLVSLALLLAGCDRAEVNSLTEGGTATAAPTVPATATLAPTLTATTQVPTVEPPTATLAPPPVEATSLPPTSPPPTSPPATSPPATSEPSPERIEFAAGATSATRTGHVDAYESDIYVLRALAGQTMDVVLTSPATDVVLEIWGADGIPLLRHVTGQTSWTGVLAATQDYFIKVVSFGSAVDYSLQVTIPPPTEPEPVRIQFAPGATSATVPGHVSAFGADLYVLGAMAGQTMSVDLVSPASDVVLEIWGADGTPLLRHVTGETTWTDTLYATQDYFIKVVSFGSAVDYSLQVTIPPPAEPEPVRIQFAPGAISATVSGHVAAHGADLYMLGAMMGQTMSVDLVSPASDVVLEIWGADGSPLLRHVAGQTSWTGALYASQDYFVKVVSFGSAVDYELTVTIPPA